MNIAALLVSFGFLIIAMTFHEFAHGWVAFKLGDMTAKHFGRLTLNPIAHIDPFWTLLLPLILYISSGGQFVFGAAKPVPINYWSLKNPKRDMILIGASGPIANFLLAFLVTSLMRFIPLSASLIYFLTHLIVINVVLGVFNLIPIPPLDGSRVLSGLLPPHLSESYSRIEPYGFMIIMLLVWFGVFGRVVWPLVEFVLKLLGL